MNSELKLANRVKDLANDFTGWGFTVVSKGCSYLVGTSLSREEGQVLNIVFEINKTGSSISTFIPGCKFDEILASKVFETLDFPVMAKGTDGEMLIIKSQIPFEILESDTLTIISETMVSMIEAMTKIVTGKL